MLINSCFIFINQEISDTAKENQKYNEHVHYLGPGGYVGKTSKWCIDL